MQAHVMILFWSESLSQRSFTGKCSFIFSKIIMVEVSFEEFLVCALHFEVSLHNSDTLILLPLKTLF